MNRQDWTLGSSGTGINLSLECPVGFVTPSDGENGGYFVMRRWFQQPMGHDMLGQPPRTCVGPLHQEDARRMTKRMLVGCATAVALWFGPYRAAAQSTPVAPRGEFVAYRLQSDAAANEAANSRVVFSHMVNVPTAAWIRLYFSELVLEGGSVIRMTSMLDGEIQTLDSAAARMWNDASAYFNGDRVLLEIVAAPGSENNRVAMEHVAAEFTDAAPEPEGTGGQCGICGTDDRVLSNDNWAGRLMPIGCTASMYNTCSCLVSAGHCITSNLVIQFNVPASQANCSLVNPPVNDQFPITSTVSQNNGVGADWSVLKAGSNGVGQSPYTRYELFRRFTSTPVAGGNSIGFWGFGLDINCVNSQRQQYSGGTVNTIFNGFFDFTADIRGGNSGSSVVRDGEIIGIVTHCTIGCPNKATRWDLPAFTNARNSMCPPCDADVVCNQQVNIDDLLSVLGMWGPCPGPCPGGCAQDIGPGETHDCDVNVDDVLVIVEGWGSCP